MAGLLFSGILMIPISLMMGWLDSVVYVSALSLWALVSGHWPAWQAARVEAAQKWRMRGNVTRKTSSPESLPPFSPGRT